MQELFAGMLWYVSDLTEPAQQVKTADLACVKLDIDERL